MGNNKKIIIGNKALTKKEFLKEHKEFRRERARISFEDKIRQLVELQKIAYRWGGKKDLIIWKL